MSFLPNPLAMVCLATLLGAATSVSILGAEAYLLSVTRPINAVYATVLAGIAYALLLRRLALRKKPFAPVAVISLALGAALLGLLLIPAIPPTFRSITWLFLAVLGYRYYRWIVSTLIVRYLDPARAQSHLSYLVATYELGMLVPLAVIFITRSAPGPMQLLSGATVFVLAAMVGTAFQFLPKANVPIAFNRRHRAPPTVAPALYRPMLWHFTTIALCIGALSVCAEYLTRIVLTEQLGSFSAIRDVSVGYRLIACGLNVVAGIGLAGLLNRKRGSPELFLIGNFVIVGIVWVGCVMTQSLFSFIALDVSRLVGRNGFVFLSGQMILAAFEQPYKREIETNLNLGLEPLSGVPMLIAFAAIHSLLPGAEKGIVLGMAFVFLVAAWIAALRFRRSLPDLLFAFVESGHKTAALHALNLLSYVRPKRYEQEMERLLSVSPKKLLRKTIILGLGHSRNLDTIDTIIKQFDSEQEEIQLAVLDAMKISNQYRAAQFLAKIVMTKVRPRTIRVRINAAAALAAMYGRHSIPFLLNGLDDEDDRIVANTLENLAEFRDPKLIPFFERLATSKTPRVRANALLGLGAFWRTRHEYRRLMREGLTSGNRRLVASLLYTVGKRRDSHFLPEIGQLLASPQAKDPSVERCLTWALIQLGDSRGYDRFAELVTGDPRAAEGFLHFFSQFPKEVRMDLVRHTTLKFRESPEAIETLRANLDRRTFDFHEELDYFYLLSRAA